MANNLLDQLQNTEVPPPPVEMRREVHERLNQWLLVGQVSELVLYGFGYAVLQFSEAILGLFNFTLTGNYQLRRGSQHDSQDDSDQNT